jgi:PAS domain S-box-containing protein
LGAPASKEFLAGGGEMGERMRALDWSRTPLGPVEGWPQSLRSPLSMLLPSKAQICFFWGPQYVVFYNDAYRPVFGAKHPQMLGQPGRVAWSEVWESQLHPLLAGVVSTGEAFSAQDLQFVLERNGFVEETYFDVSYDPVRVESGEVGGVYCIVTETTGRVVGERRLALLKDLAARNATARSAREACVLAMETLAARPHDIPFAAAYLDGELQAGTPGERPGLVKELPIGTAGRLVVGLNPRRPFDDQYRGFLELVAGQLATAVANARAYEEERKRVEALAELDRAKTAFFSNVSHEFRTPLTLMLGPLEEAMARELPAEARAQLEVAERNGQRLLKLVNTLLDFARIEAGRAQASYEPIDLGALTAELASNFRSACERAGLTLEVDCPPLGEPAYVDRGMWEKIVLNLLSNAFKFTLQGGISVSLKRTGNRCVLAVRDSGAGIPPEALPRMFERFHRVEGTPGRSHEGSGIGLALVHELVKLHGGSIGVDSELDKGSTFTVAIPCGAAHLPAERLKAARAEATTGVRADAYVDEALGWLPGADRPPAAPKTGKRILVADDNADLREYVRRLLAEEYEAEAVADGAAALAAARARKPDLIVSDVMMPGLDGFGLIRALRADLELRTTPVVLLSARAGEEARMEGLGKGADDYLTKPFSARELLVRVGALLQSADYRREAEGRLRESEERFRAMANTAPAILWICEPDGACSFLSRGWYDFTGQTEADALGRGWTTAVHPDDRERAGRVFMEANTRREPFSMDYRLRRKDGEYRWAIDAGRPRFGADGEFLGLIGSVIDVHERKQAEETLHEEARTLETLNRVGRTLAGELDLEKTVQAVTDAATELSGAEFGAFFYNVKNEKGESYLLYSLSGAPREAFAKFGMPRNTAVFAPTFGGEGVVRIDDVTKDPRYGKSAPHHGMPKGHLPVRSYLAASVVSRTGEVIGGLFFGHSRPGVFTERAERLVAGIAGQAAVAIDNARLYEESRRLVARLSEADRRKDEFLATLSHELRNPLAPLRSSLDILRLPGAVGDTAPVREMMERQVNHLVRLTDDLLEMSRITRGAFELRRERVELAEVVRNAVETSEPAIRAGGHDLVVSLPPSALWLDGDPVRLAQILSNLLNNAARYTEARAEHGGRIQVRARREGNQAVVSVRDNGMGIEPAALERVFEMFSRGERSSGLGIGLALARRLAEMHGGTIHAASAGAGQGAEFTVRLPLAAPLEAPAQPAQPGAGALRPRRILVVDDNRDAADSLALLLKALGSEVRVAYDGPSALDAFRSWGPAVVLLDLGMPGMDGYSVARKLREDPAGRQVPIVAISGWGQEDDRRRAREAGFDHHMVKPPDLGALRSLLGSMPEQRP